MSHTYLLAIDQGTTNSRAIIFNHQGHLISQHEIPLKQMFPQSGWVEQDPLEMLQNSVLCCQNALQKANLKPQDILGIGLSNQRETTILWNKITGQAIYPAISWQDRRTSGYCKMLKTRGLEEKIKTRTGLLIDPYFSATKIVWILENVPDAKKLVQQGQLCFGTVDSYLIWHLTKPKRHVTDATNASRTLFFDIQKQQYDQDLLTAFNIPSSILPDVVDCTHDFGTLDPAILGFPIPILGVAGDQQAATIGQACFSEGMIKATYGTGGFLLMNTGQKIIHSTEHLISTIAYRLNGCVTYGLEGSFFSAGESVKWLRDKLHLIQKASDTEESATQLEDTEGVYLVPAFTGLGAPYWAPEARAMILGIERTTTQHHLIRAALESVAYQTRDLLDAMKKESTLEIANLRVDGGMVANRWLIQFIADLLNHAIERTACLETTALGVAFLAGLQGGMFSSLDEIAKYWHADLILQPTLSASKREMLYQGWEKAVKTTIAYSS